MKPTRLLPRRSLLLLVALAACGHGLASIADYPAPPVALARASEGPEVDALVTAFYDTAFAPEALRAQIAAVLAKDPESSRAHEVAGYFELLRGDAHTSFEHFLAAARDLGSPFTRAYLYEMERDDRTVSEEAATMRLLEALVATHPDATVRAQARSDLAGHLRRHGRSKEADAHIAALGFVGRWRMIGPFDNDQGKGFFTAYPPENGVQLDSELSGKILPVRWRVVPGLDPFGAVPLMDFLAPADHALAYLVTYVRAPSARPAELRLTVSDATQVWVNHALVAAEEKLEAGELDNLVVPLSLAAGWNEILVKVSRDDGPWRVAARLTAPGGEPLPDLEVSADGQVFAATSAPRPGAMAFVPEAVRQLAGGRRSFLASRFARVAGRDREVLPPLEALHQKLPDNVAYRYFTALAYWDNDELGKAIDLLNAGVAQSGEALPAYLMKRARYYRQKKLWEKATVDLKRALELVPAARFAVMDLAELYGARGWQTDRCTTLEAARRRWPDSAWIMGELGDCLGARGYDERAQAAYRSGHALVPGASWYLDRLEGIAERRNEWAEARRLIAEQRRLTPSKAGLHLDECELDRKSGDAAAADSCIQAVTAQAPDWSRPYERRAELLYEQGRRDEATELYQQALARDPKNAALAERVDYLAPKGLGLLTPYVPTQAAIDEIVANAERVVAAPGAQIVMLLDHEVTEVGNDGSARRIVTQVSRAENEQGAERLTRDDLPGRGTLKILAVYSRSKNGERQEASSIADNVVRFRKLEPGSIVVLQYVHYQPPGHFLPNHFAETWVFQGMRRQEEASTWVLVLPKGRYLNVATRGEVKVDTKEEGGAVVRTFSATHVPPLMDEPMMPPAGDLLRQVSVSTVANWDEYVRWERALLSEAFRSSPELEALAQKLTGGATTPREKLERLYHFAAREIRYQQEYETTIAGVRPHACPVILERGYGDCKDKAVLLIRLAQAAGLRLEVAILRTTDAGQVERDIPNQQFNHAIVYVPEQPGFERGFFLDPTTDGLDIGNLRSDDQGALSLVLDPEGESYRFLEIPYQEPALEYEQHHIVIRVASPEAGTATDELRMRGADAAQVRRLFKNPEVAGRALQGLSATLFPGSTLTSKEAEGTDDIWKPLVLRLGIDIGNSIKPQEDSWRITVPGMLGIAKAASLATRQTPIWFGPPDTLAYDVEIELPAGYRLQHTPAAFTVEQTCFTARRESEQTPRKARLRFELVRRCPKVELASYGEFRAALQKLVSQFQDQIVFVAEAPPAAVAKGRPGH